MDTIFNETQLLRNTTRTKITSTIDLFYNIKLNKILTYNIWYNDILCTNTQPGLQVLTIFDNIKIQIYINVKLYCS